jgi:hypothetical protein
MTGSGLKPSSGPRSWASSSTMARSMCTVSDGVDAPRRHRCAKWSTFIIWAKNTSTLRRAGYQRQYEPILYGWPCMHSAWNKPVPVPLTIPYPISPANEELTLRSGGVDQVG